MWPNLGEILNSVAKELSGPVGSEVEYLSKHPPQVFLKNNPYAQFFVYEFRGEEPLPDYVTGPKVSITATTKEIYSLVSAKSIMATARATLPWSIDRFLCHQLPSTSSVVGDAYAIEAHLVKRTSLRHDNSMNSPEFSYSIQTYIKIHHVKDRN